MCLYRNISAIWLAFPWSAGLKRHHTISFFIPEHFHCQKSQSSLLHFRIFHSPLVQGLWLSCDSNGLGFCLCRVSVRPYLLFILPDAIWFANSSHSFSGNTRLWAKHVTHKSGSCCIQPQGEGTCTLPQSKTWTAGVGEYSLWHVTITVARSATILHTSSI